MFDSYSKCWFVSSHYRPVGTFSAFRALNLQPIWGPWKRLTGEIMLVKRALIMIAHLENQILAEASILVEGDDTSWDLNQILIVYSSEGETAEKIPNL